MTNDKTGTSIDVDFEGDGSAEAIDPFFYSNFLSSLRMPELPERRLKFENPYENSWHASIPILESAGCISRQHRLKLTTLGREIAEALCPVVERLHRLCERGTASSLRRCVLGAVAMGDSILAQELEAVSSEASPVFTSIAGESKALNARRAEMLSAIVATSAKQRIPEFEALAAMGPEVALSVVSKALFRTPVDGLANKALEVVNKWNRKEVSQQLASLIVHRYRESGSLLSRLTALLRPRRDDLLPRGYQVVHAATALLQREDVRLMSTEMKGVLLALMKTVEGANAGEAALVTYILDQEAGLGAIESNLSHRVPAAYQDAVAACVVIGTQATFSLLVKALGNANAQVQHNAACALSMFGDSAAKELARDWFRRNDGINSPLGREVAIGERTLQTYTFEDVSHANMDAFLTSALSRLRENFHPILLRSSQ